MKLQKIPALRQSSAKPAELAAEFTSLHLTQLNPAHLEGVPLPCVRQMLEDKLSRFINEQKDVIGILLKRGYVTPLLMLIYATIDILGFISIRGSDKMGAGKSFRGFADKYITRNLKNINSDDLWGARCGLLHANAPESDLSRKRKVKEILYSWGSASHDIAIEVIRRENAEHKYVAMKIEDLITALEHGLELLQAEMKKDMKYAKFVNSNVGKFYSLIHVPRHEGAI